MVLYFFQKYWTVLGDFVIDFVQKAFEANEFDPALNKSIITLIPKQKKPEKMSQFQPISLCNVLVKIVIKAYRMKPLVAKLVGEEQGGFIPSRQVANNILIAQEVMHSMRCK